jgi:hypothetical protein
MQFKAAYHALAKDERCFCAANRDLEADAIEIRMRATRRLDQLRQVQKEQFGLNRGNAGGFANNPPDERPRSRSLMRHSRRGRGFGRAPEG